MSTSIWQNYAVNEGEEPLHIHLDSLHLWVKKVNEEFWITHSYAEDKSQLQAPGSSTEWERWAPQANETDIRVRPVFSDLPVIVSSEYPLKLTPGAKIEVFCRIPAWMEISFAKSKYMLDEIPINKLSRTWFGTTMEGELCYWLTSKARRSLAEVESKPYLTNCPIQIVNKSDAELNFERFCYRVERLGIYKVNNELWADETKIVYQGEEQHSDVTMTGKLPAHLGKGELITKPRHPVSRSFATRTFKMLFDDTLISAR